METKIFHGIREHSQLFSERSNNTSNNSSPGQASTAGLIVIVSAYLLSYLIGLRKFGKNYENFAVQCEPTPFLFHYEDEVDCFVCIV